MKLLLKQKHIHVNGAEMGKPTPLGLAAEAGHTEVVKELLAHPRLNVNETCEPWFGGTALLVAARKGHVKAVDLILRDSRVHPNQEDHYRKTAL